MSRALTTPSGMIRNEIVVHAENASHVQLMAMLGAILPEERPDDR